MDKKTVTIKQIKSTIGVLEKHKQTMRALGLKKINHQVTHTLTPSIAGMIRHVKHLLEIV